jgi:hypothetical protein
MSRKFLIIAIAILAAGAAPALAAGNGQDKKVSKAHSARVVAPSTLGSARDSVNDFSRFPTDYLNDRFGDRQAQGRL